MSYNRFQSVVADGAMAPSLNLDVIRKMRCVNHPEEEMHADACMWTARLSAIPRRWVSPSLVQGGHSGQLSQHCWCRGASR